MDKSKLRAALVDTIRTHLPSFERSARVTCLLSVRVDGSNDSAVFLDIVEDLPAATPALLTPQKFEAASEVAAPTMMSALKVEKSSKRKSQAPQKMVANGLDSYVTAAQPANQSLAAAPAVTVAATAPPTTSAGLPSAIKKEAGGFFYLNNPGFPQPHFLLPTGFLTTSVFPTPTAVFQRPQAPPSMTQQPAMTQSVSSATMARPDTAASSLRSPTASAEVGDSSSSGGANYESLYNDVMNQQHPVPAAAPSGSRSRSLFGLRSRRGGHRSFPCNQCPEAFASLATLSKHTYSMHKSYKCTFCSASFTQRSNLQRHSLKHVGFKPFACRCCQKSYYRKDHLVRHIEVTHPGNEPKRNIETKLTSSECLEFLERKFESGEYSVAIDADGDGEGEAEGDVDEEMPDEEELAETEAPPEAGAGEAKPEEAAAMSAEPADGDGPQTVGDAAATVRPEGGQNQTGADVMETVPMDPTAEAAAAAADTADNVSGQTLTIQQALDLQHQQLQQQEPQANWVRHQEAVDAASVTEAAGAC